MPFNDAIDSPREVNLLGCAVKIYDRTMKDVFDLEDAVRSTKGNPAMITGYYYAQMISDALKPNYQRLKWYQFIKKYQLKRRYNVKRLIKNLTLKQLVELAKEVYRAGGATEDDIENIFEVKKKNKGTSRTAQGSTGKSPT